MSWSLRNDDAEEDDQRNSKFLDLNGMLMALKIVHYNSWYISLPSCANQKREMTSFRVSKERDPLRLILRISI